MVSFTLPRVAQHMKTNLGNHSPVFTIATYLYFSCCHLDVKVPPFITVNQNSEA